MILSVIHVIRVTGQNEVSVRGARGKEIDLSRRSVYVVIGS